MTMTRKEFLRSAAAVVGGGMALTALGCGNNGGDPVCGSTIAQNHGHSLGVARVEVEAGTEKTYHIAGGADHDHTVTLTAAQFATLQAGSPVTVTSSPDIGLGTHDHDVTVNCA